MSPGCRTKSSRRASLCMAPRTVFTLNELDGQSGVDAIARPLAAQVKLEQQCAPEAQLGMVPALRGCPSARTRARALKCRMASLCRSVRRGTSAWRCASS